MAEGQRDLLTLALELEQQGKMRRIGNAFILLGPQSAEAKAEAERGFQELRKHYNTIFLGLQAEQRRQQREAQAELWNYRITH